MADKLKKLLKKPENMMCLRFGKCSPEHLKRLRVAEGALATIIVIAAGYGVQQKIRGEKIHALRPSITSKDEQASQSSTLLSTKSLEKEYSHIEGAEDLFKYWNEKGEKERKEFENYLSAPLE